jgi:glyoxalase family protein
LVDVAAVRATPGRIAVGSIHHIAFRTASDETEAAWRAHLQAAGVQVTPPQDRQYFHSIYFREPGGVLFEIATDPPGFTFDESRAELGSDLKLPPWLEPSRPRIEASLLPLHLPQEIR